MTDPTSSGVKTSEFWLALLSPLIAVYGVLAVQFGWSDNTDAFTNALPFVASLAAAVASHGFSKSRAVVKQAVLDNAVAIPAPPTTPTTPPPSSNLALAVAQLTDAA